MLFNILQCARWPPATNHYLVQNINSNEGKQATLLGKNLAVRKPDNPKFVAGKAKYCRFQGQDLEYTKGYAVR